MISAASHKSPSMVPDTSEAAERRSINRYLTPSPPLPPLITSPWSESSPFPGLCCEVVVDWMPGGGADAHSDAQKGVGFWPVREMEF